MLIDMKAPIRQALLNNAALVSLLGGKHVYPLVSPDAAIESYITYQEIVNFDKDYAEDKALNSEIHFHFDIWTPYNTGPITQEVNRTMESLGFKHSSGPDRYDPDTNSYGKIMRYKTIKFGG
ncbi:MAG: tail completion protein gp17 [Bacillota bacterium]